LSFPAPFFSSVTSAPFIPSLRAVPERRLDLSGARWLGADVARFAVHHAAHTARTRTVLTFVLSQNVRWRGSWTMDAFAATCLRLLPRIPAGMYYRFVAVFV